MSGTTPEIGTIGWQDLTVPDAGQVRDFYAAGSGRSVAGICHARGVNADLPAQWLLYLTVADLDASLAACRGRGGQVLAGPKTMGGARYAAIRDPAGAVAALYQSAP